MIVAGLDMDFEAGALIHVLLGSCPGDVYAKDAYAKELDTICDMVDVPRERVALLKTITERAKHELDVSDARYQVYFGPLEPDEDECFADVLGCVAAARENAADDENRRLATLHALASFFQLEGDAPQSQDELMRSLIPSNHAPQAKWLCMEALGDFDRCWQTLDELRAPTRRLLENYRPQMEDMVKTAQRELAARGEDTLLSDFGIRVGERQVKLYVSLILYTSLYLHDRGTDASAVIPAHMGCLVPYIRDNQQVMMSDEYLMMLLHALDDKARMTILLSLKQGDKIGRELAKAASISPATVSHHINELISAKLVTVEKQGASLRYSLDKENVKKALDQLAKRLTV